MDDARVPIPEEIRLYNADGEAGVSPIDYFFIKSAAAAEAAAGQVWIYVNERAMDSICIKHLHARVWLEWLIVTRIAGCCVIKVDRVFR